MTLHLVPAGRVTAIEWDACLAPRTAPAPVPSMAEWRDRLISVAAVVAVAAIWLATSAIGEELIDDSTEIRRDEPDCDTEGWR